MNEVEQLKIRQIRYDLNWIANEMKPQENDILWEFVCHKMKVVGELFEDIGISVSMFDNVVDAGYRSELIDMKNKAESLLEDLEALP